jgi:hypothetical protein
MKTPIVYILESSLDGSSEEVSLSKTLLHPHAYVPMDLALALIVKIAGLRCKIDSKPPLTVRELFIDEPETLTMVDELLVHIKAMR